MIVEHIKTNKIIIWFDVILLIEDLYKDRR